MAGNDPIYRKAVWKNLIGFVFCVLSLSAILTMTGCQKNKYIRFENRSSIALRIYESDSGHFLGTSLPKTNKRLEKSVLLQGASDLCLILKRSNGTLVKILDIPYDEVRTSQGDIYAVYSPDKP